MKKNIKTNLLLEWLLSPIRIFRDRWKGITHLKIIALNNQRRFIQVQGNSN